MPPQSGIKAFNANPKYIVGTMPRKPNLYCLLFSYFTLIGTGQNFGHPVGFLSF